ncbi:hypothetical protein [Pseudoalteromonas phage Cr39582]|uniref:Uncharacterized protein n=1 Tax=Pseudoalteromonas phage Cr39582 TaxID=2099852 RepID=A0A2P1CL11_9VIRU|nr:hypothetical protein FDJ46_gp04 [Pseudoalteromonas phage Cr39582]AVJ51868.1 hypothetical protein [Pseudoalteromonas phage Cr39582]
MSDKQNIVSLFRFDEIAVHTVLAFTALRLSERWIKTINKSIPLKVKPEPEQIELISDLIDVLHDSGSSVVAHKLDDAMCKWCELLLDA